MKEPEALLLITSYGTLGIPLSKAQQILPHLVTVRSDYSDGKYTYTLKDQALELKLLDRTTVITMLVADKLDNDKE